MTTATGRATYAGTAGSTAARVNGTGTNVYSGTSATASQVMATGTSAYSGSGAVAAGRVSGTDAEMYSGNATSAPRISGSSSALYDGTVTVSDRITVATDATYDGLAPSTIDVKTTAESGEFFTATADQGGTWSAVFPPELIVPAKFLAVSSDATSCIVYAPPSSKGYTFFLSCTSASASVQVQPTSIDDRRGKPVVIYSRDELPLPFNPAG